MLRPKRPLKQPQNPIVDMEQFYLNQYFASPSQQQSYDHRFPPVDMARLHQLERRVARLEHHLGLPPFETTG